MTSHSRQGRRRSCDLLEEGQELRLALLGTSRRSTSLCEPRPEAAAEAMECSADLTILVLAQLRNLRARCPSNRFLSVNVSPKDLANPTVQQCLEESLDGVFIEITETAWPPHRDDVLAGVEQARRAGAKIASDDVGAGYAGLMQLVELRPDLLKIDRDLVNLLGTDPAADAVLSVLGELASQLDACDHCPSSITLTTSPP